MLLGASAVLLERANGASLSSAHGSQNGSRFASGAS